ncbi:hypothetical protein A2917_02750 [Candidatus Nomurabacteria bacterium RIFCSPLOWO2_01_FULL_42_17]|uniref:Uncharacterized protein n=1 Tax=Candidatus Nomurabacteria bacterium RIFCSPLOWO2_01_FULL_42_17 TaxID=1801780 RepID=A0A1F6XMX8_9BACT|nr:MAG: hypothetical protein A2917_02750 [Candidatus Nomurabacteria bacterium RIFCSPLOWO2_01_FULL_42_17]
MVIVQRLIPRVTWVKKIAGERCGEIGLVFYVNVKDNWFAVIFLGDQKATFDCDPSEFKIVGVPGTVARGDL